MANILRKHRLNKHMMILLAVILFTGLLFIMTAQSAYAQETVLASGTDGNITWSAVYDDEAVYDAERAKTDPSFVGMRILYLSGKGDMEDYSDDGVHCAGTKYAPWHITMGYINGQEVYLNDYNKVVIGEGITSIGDCAFTYRTHWTWNYPPKEIVIPDSVTRIGDAAFYNASAERIIVPDSVKTIGVVAFNPKSTIVCSYGSAAYNYCIENNQLMEVTGLNVGFTVNGSTSATITKGQTVSYSLTPNIPDIVPTIKSEDPDLLSVDTENHTIAAIGSGYTGTIRAYFHGMSWEIKITVPESIDTAEIMIPSQVYTGSAVTPQPDVWFEGIILKNGTDYTISYENNVNAGTATAVFTGAGSYAGTKSVTFSINKASQPMKVSAKKTAKIKYSTLKKKAQTLKASKVMKITNYKGTLTYKKTKGNKKITVNQKTGKIKIAKKLKKGTYSVKIKVTASGNSNYKKGSKNVTVNIKVK